MKKSSSLIILLLSAISYAQIVEIPDANFKNVLLNQNCADFDNDNIYDGDVDTNNDGEIQVSEAEAVFRLRATNQGIVSTQGLESFTNLVVLNFTGNNIESIDLSALLDIESFTLFGNELTSINLSQNPSLKEAYLASNQLTSLDISQNVSLESLSLWGNELTEIDPSLNVNLVELNVEGNLLTELNVSQNTNLSRLWCWNNDLTSLDLRNGNNNNMNVMVATFNPNLPCILVDDENASRPNCDGDWGWCKDETSSYVEDCILGVTDFETGNIYLLPNPTNDLLIIESQTPIESVLIYSSTGQVVQSSKYTKKIKVDQLSKGIYFAHIFMEGQLSVQQFIKN